MFEDNRFVVFPDISPAAKVHLLVITKVLLQPERKSQREPENQREGAREKVKESQRESQRET